MADTSERDRFVERMGGALTDAGLPRLPSRVFAALLVDDDGRMTAAELGEALGISPAAVSGAVNYLARLGMIRRERERGSRRDVYVVDEDAWHGTMMREDQAYAADAGRARRRRSRRSGPPTRRTGGWWSPASSWRSSARRCAGSRAAGRSTASGSSATCP